LSQLIGLLLSIAVAKNKRNNRPTKRRRVRNRDLTKTNLSDVPHRFDWRDRKVVSAVRNQGPCGACWAHSTVATVESMVAIKTDKLTEFSVQQLVDCSNEENQGCRGGDTCSALIWMDKNNITLESAEMYPSRDHAQKCKSKADAIGVQIQSNYTCDSFINKEHKIVHLLAHHGPLIAAVDASTWQHYLGGVIQYHCFNDLNHAVQITGYDLTGIILINCINSYPYYWQSHKTGAIPFFNVRNTWDVSFGIEGYIHIAIGHNLCGIAEEISAIDVKTIPKEFY